MTGAPRYYVKPYSLLADLSPLIFRIAPVPRRPSFAENGPGWLIVVLSQWLQLDRFKFGVVYF